MSKMSLASTTDKSCNIQEDDDDSDMEVDPSQTFSDLSQPAYGYKNSAISVHLLAASMRNYFEVKVMQNHYVVAARIARDLCLKRIDTVVIECQAADQVERKGSPDASTIGDKQRMRRMFDQAEVGMTCLGAWEIELIELFSICKFGDDAGSLGDGTCNDILVELKRIEGGGKEERASWIDGWPILPGIA